MYADATVSSASSNPFATIKTDKLASQYTQFQFYAVPRFVAENPSLSSDAKQLYGFHNTKAGKQRYLEGWTREQIANHFGWSLARFKRASAELTSHGLILSLQRGNNEANVYVPLAHPDMQLPQQELIARQIELPRHVQWLVDRAEKRKMGGSRVSHRGGRGGSPASHPLDLKSKINKQEKEQGKAMPLPALLPATTTSYTTVYISTLAPAPIPVIAPGDSNVGFTPSQPEIKSEPKPESKPPDQSKTQIKDQPKKPKVRKAKSKHSIELCLRFALAEKDRKGTIEDVEDFGAACYWIGAHDKEIDRWLCRRAVAEVGKYNPNLTATAKPVEQISQQTSTPAQQQTNSTAEQDLRELQYRQKLSDLRDKTFEDLSPGDKQQLIQDKLDDMKFSKLSKQFARMFPEYRLAHAIDQVKKDLVPS